MGQSEIPPGIPLEGFIKITRPDTPELPADKRVALIRLGNELLARGDLERAKKIFFTTNYKEGLTKVGVTLFQQGDYLEALRFFYLAGNKEKIAIICSRIAEVVKIWLRSEM